MAKDPAFLFYPGDYLKDTQCLSEKSQVAYDRIMCEHMRNICITQQQLNFFTKRLNPDEKNELLFVLDKIEGGFQIGWVADSICKRKDYSKSRAENRKGKTKNISTSYDSHMENANGNINEDDNKREDENFGKSENLLLVPEMFEVFKKNNPTYLGSIERDYKPLFSIASFFCEIGKLQGSPDLHKPKILEVWGLVSKVISKDDFYKQKSLSTISNQIQAITQKSLNGESTTKNGKQNYGSAERLDKLNRLFAERYRSGGSTTS